MTRDDRLVNGAPAEPGLVIATKTYYSGLHLRSGKLFADKAYELEQQGNPAYDPAIMQTQFAYVGATVLFAVAFLEATINEILVDVTSESSGGIMKTLAEPDRERLARLWELGIPRTAGYSILEKYEVTLAALDKPDFLRSHHEYGDIKALTLLRNAITHFEPEWWEHAVGEVKPQKELAVLERNLKSKFPESPLVGNLSPYFPYRALGYGCAKWALLSSVRFTDRFFNLLGASPEYMTLRGPLSLK